MNENQASCKKAFSVILKLTDLREAMEIGEFLEALLA